MRLSLLTGAERTPKRNLQDMGSYQLTDKFFAMWLLRKD